MEKRLRFTMESDKLYSCIFDNGNELTCFELVDLLNNQNNEIERLKQGFNELLAVHTKVMQTLDDEFISKALSDDGDSV